jgi:hypothetical protein
MFNPYNPKKLTCKQLCGLDWIMDRLYKEFFQSGITGLGSNFDKISLTHPLCMLS